MQFSRKSFIILLAFLIAVLDRSFFPVIFDIPFPFVSFNADMLLVALGMREEAFLFSFAVGLFLDMLAYQPLGLTSLFLILTISLAFAFKKRVSDWIPAYYLVGLLSLAFFGFKLWGFAYISPMFILANVLGFSSFAYLILKSNARGL